jgi:alkanesulfonate monooxygenase SsuD/methylene tetrahydromethanopterin reductase-like flavin-dependent oxidoreductase (luciferase family)
VTRGDSTEHLSAARVEIGNEHMTMRLRLGIAYPQASMGGSPAALSAFARGVEDAAFAHIALYDQVLGADRAVWPDLMGPWRADHEFNDVFVALGFLAAATSTIELSPQVVILPQRQAAVVARQAASVAQLSGNRLRMGIGVGEPRGVPSARRRRRAARSHRRRAAGGNGRPVLGKVMEFNGRWHALDHVALNPIPDAPIPLWFGGIVTQTFDRIARHGQGWIALYDRPGEGTDRRLRRLRLATERLGRDAQSVGVDAWVSMGGTTSSRLATRG